MVQHGSCNFNTPSELALANTEGLSEHEAEKLKPFCSSTEMRSSTYGLVGFTK